MKNFLRLVYFFILSSYYCFAQNYIEIKSLQTYVGNDQTSVPILKRNQFKSHKLTIEFDIATDSPPIIELRFKFCDKNWIPEKNIFLNNPLTNYASNLWYDQLPTSVKSASYHFKGRYPNKQIDLPFDGKWMYEIVNVDDNDKILDRGKFIVVSDNLPINISVKKNNLNDHNVSNNALNDVYEMSVSLNLPDTLFPDYIENIEIIQNHLLDFPIVLNKENTKNRYYEWDGARYFLFGARNIYPGNSYRQTNLMDINRFAPPKTNAQLDMVETSNFYLNPTHDFLGGMKLLNWRDEYAQYMDVKFTLRAPVKLNKSVYLVGAFTDWQIWPTYKMNDNHGLYTLEVELKRGIYDYQYVLGEQNGNNIENQDWLYMQGNDYRRTAVYNIFVYYRTRDNGEYDQIIGYKRIVINGK